MYKHRVHSISREIIGGRSWRRGQSTVGVLRAGGGGGVKGGGGQEGGGGG